MKQTINEKNKLQFCKTCKKKRPENSFLSIFGKNKAPVCQKCQEHTKEDRKQIREKFVNHMREKCFQKEVKLYGKMDDWKVEIDIKLGDVLEEHEIAVWSSDTELFMLQDYKEVDQEELQHILTKQYIGLYSIAFKHCKQCGEITSFKQLQNKKRPGVCKCCREKDKETKQEKKEKDITNRLYPYETQGVKRETVYSDVK